VAVFKNPRRDIEGFIGGDFRKGCGRPAGVATQF